MTCPRCTGFLYQDHDVETETLEIRCVNCGCRPLLVTRPPDPVMQGRRPGNRCANCVRDKEPGYTQCARCRTYQKDYKRRVRAEA